MAKQQHLALESDLVDALTAHLELGARGGLPNPEHAAQLLRRFKLAVAESGADAPTNSPGGVG